MIAVILLASLALRVSALPVHDVRSSLLSQRGATQAPQVQSVEATNQKPQTPAPLSPNLEQAQPGVPQQPVLEGGPQIVPFLQQYTWSPLGGSPAMVQPSIQESLPANQPALPHRPLVFTPYGYFPLFLSPYTNQLLFPYKFPMQFEAALPQTPANLPQNGPLLPAEAPPVAAAAGDTPQPMQQNAQIMYMLQQPMGSPLGSLSSEELEIVAKMSQLGVYVPTVLANPQVGAVQPANQATGLANLEQPANVEPTDGAPPTAVPHTRGLAGSGPQPSTNRGPVGLEKATLDAATVQTPVKPKLQRTQGNLARDCGHQQ